MRLRVIGIDQDTGPTCKVASFQLYVRFSRELAKQRTATKKGRGVLQLFWGHRAGKWQSQELHPSPKLFADGTVPSQSTAMIIY